MKLSTLALTVAILVPTAPEAAVTRGNNVRVRPQVPVTAESPRRPLGNNSPVLASDPTDPAFMALAARIDGPDYSCTLHLSADGGSSWAPAPQIPLVPKGAEKCYAPSVAFDSAGTLFYSFSGLAGTSNSPIGLFLTSSSDKGNTFASPRKVLGPHSYMVQMKIDRTQGEVGRIHFVWVSAGTEPAASGFSPGHNPILSQFSDDGGRNFSPPVRVSDPARERTVRPAIAFGEDGTVHVLYYDLKEDARDYLGLEGPTWDGTWALVAASSKDGGSHFSRGVVVDNSIVPPERIMLIFNASPPAVAADKEGEVYASWWDARNGDWDIFLSASGNNGSNWSKPLRINDDQMRNGRHQYLPGMNVAPTGRVDIAFYDRRRDPENLRNDVYYAYSKPGGQRFSSNVRLNEFSFDSRIGFTYSPSILPGSRGLFEFGSHPALVSSESGAVVAWTDTINSHPERYRHQNIFAAGILLPEDDATVPLFVWLLAVSSVGTGAAIVLILIRRKVRARSA